MSYIREKPPLTPLLRSKEAAARLGISTAALAKRRKRGRPPPYVRLGPGRSDHVRYEAEVIEALIAAGRCDPTKPEPK